VDFLLNSFAQTEPQRGTGDLINDLARTPLSQVVIFIVVLSVLRLAMFGVLKNTPPHKRTGFYSVLRVANEIFDAFVYAGAFVFLIIRPFALQTFRIPSGSMWPTLHVYDYIVANKAIYRYSDPKFGDIVVFRPPVEATLNHPEQVDANGEVKVDFIKRLIGLPGDTIEIRDGVLFRNGEAVVDKYKHMSAGIHTGPGGESDEFRELTPEEVKSSTPTSFKFVEYNHQLWPLNYTVYDTNSPNVRGNASEINRPYQVATRYEISDPAVAQHMVDLPPAKIPPGYYFMMGDNRNGSFDGRAWGLVPREAIIGRSEFIWLPFSRWGITR
jgi:signal peptidase I